MKKTNETLQTVVLLLLAAVLVVGLWQMVKPQLAAGDTSGNTAVTVPTVQPETLPIIVVIPATAEAAPIAPGDAVVIVAPATWTPAAPALRPNCRPMQRCAP